MGVLSAATVVANDHCDGVLAVVFNETCRGEECNRTIIRTWTATDTRLKTTLCTQTITVHYTTLCSFTQGFYGNPKGRFNGIPSQRWRAESI